MTEQQARKRAHELARKHQRPYFVIWCPEEWDAEPNHYQVSTEDELDTFYQGVSESNVVAYVEP